MRYLLIAHRCGPGKYPEQSIASARNAISVGADMVEMDIQYTSDGIPVICHDPNTKRMFGEDCLVKDMAFCHFMTLRQVQDSSYPSHSLQNIFESGINPVLFHCKITGSRLEDLAKRIVCNDFKDKCVIGVQQPEDVEIIKAVSEDIRVLSFMPSIDLFDRFLKSKAEYIRLWEPWVNQELVDRVHNAGKKVWIMAGEPRPDSVGYTSADNLIRWKKMGCDGVLVNDIVWAKGVLEQK